MTGRVGVIVRSPGVRQLAMDGRPLYRFSGDRKPGNIRGNGVGNLWWAMTPTGLSATRFPSSPSTYRPASGTTLTVVDTAVGPVVADDRHQVVYVYGDDTATKSACTGNWCLVDWPPLQADGPPSVSSGITAPVTTISGAPSVPQLALGGHPLYTFAGDLHPGDIRGEGLGGDWFLLAPSGMVVRPPSHPDQDSS